MWNTLFRHLHHVTFYYSVNKNYNNCSANTITSNYFVNKFGEQRKVIELRNNFENGLIPFDRWIHQLLNNIWLHSWCFADMAAIAGFTEFKANFKSSNDTERLFTPAPTEIKKKYRVIFFLIENGGKQNAYHFSSQSLCQFVWAILPCMQFWFPLRSVLQLFLPAHLSVRRATFAIRSWNAEWYSFDLSPMANRPEFFARNGARRRCRFPCEM